MKADTFIKLLRKVIREEVQAVVREELGLLLETPESKPVVTESKKATVKNSMIESIRPTKPKQSIKQTSFTKNSILNEMLNDTAYSGEWRSVIEANSNMAQGFSSMMGEYGYSEPTVVNSVDQMLSSTRPSGDINAVQINVVPDFSQVMAKMKENGRI